MRFFTRFAANDRFGNLSYRFRVKRFKLLVDLLAKNNLLEPRLIDLGGGTDYAWSILKHNLSFVFKPILINIDKHKLTNSEYPRIVGDVNNLNFLKNNSCDVIYSNSLIEHLPSYDLQKKFANNIKIKCEYYFIQTPAFFFPIEPHFLFPFFHWLPARLRILLLKNFNLGWFSKIEDYNEAISTVNSIRILKKYELRELFPGSTIIKEKFLFLTKSYIITNLIKHL